MKDNGGYRLAAIEARITRLEERVDELFARVDLLLEALQRRVSGPQALGEVRSESANQQ